MTAKVGDHHLAVQNIHLAADRFDINPFAHNHLLN
jgi:hypothetical protein